MDENIPYPVYCNLKANESYRWCSCGQSANRPFCDKTTCGDKAVVFKAPVTETNYLCGCGLTTNPPYCDGSHAKLYLEYMKKMRQDKENL